MDESDDRPLVRSPSCWDFTELEEAISPVQIDNDEYEQKWEKHWRRIPDTSTGKVNLQKSPSRSVLKRKKPLATMTSISIDIPVTPVIPDMDDTTEPATPAVTSATSITKSVIIPAETSTPVLATTTSAFALTLTPIAQASTSALTPTFGTLSSRLLASYTIRILGYKRVKFTDATDS